MRTLARPCAARAAGSLRDPERIDSTKRRVLTLVVSRPRFNRALKGLFKAPHRSPLAIQYNRNGTIAPEALPSGATFGALNLGGRHPRPQGDPFGDCLKIEAGRWNSQTGSLPPTRRPQRASPMRTAHGSRPQARTLRLDVYPSTTSRCETSPLEAQAASSLQRRPVDNSR